MAFARRHFRQDLNLPSASCARNLHKIYVPPSSILPLSHSLSLSLSACVSVRVVKIRISQAGQVSKKGSDNNCARLLLSALSVGLGYTPLPPCLVVFVASI